MFRYITAITMAAALALPVMAQDAERTATANDMEILRQKVKADKKAVVAANLMLTEAEGAKFWPIYDQYQTELDQINRRKGQLILDYANAFNKGPVPDDVASKLLTEFQAIDMAESNLRMQTMPKVIAALPPVKAGRYLQIESKIRAVINYELASGIPLIE